MEANTERNRRKTRVGLVESNKMDKTIVVRVDRLVKHPAYKKAIRWIAGRKVLHRQNQYLNNL